MGFKWVYYYTSKEYGLDAIIDEKLKICTLDSANDINEHSSIYSDGDKTYNNFINTQLKAGMKYGYLCFSEQWDNGTMWGHYGGTHKGICLGFDIDESALIKMEYIDNKINLNNYNPILAKFMKPGNYLVEKILNLMTGVTKKNLDI